MHELQLQDLGSGRADCGPVLAEQTLLLTRATVPGHVPGGSVGLDESTIGHRGS